MDSSDLPSFAGAIYCINDLGCSLYPVAVGANFSGIYGTGEAIAVASSSSSSSRRRRSRRLDNNEEQHFVGETFTVGDDQRSFSLPEPDAINRFLQTRQMKFEDKCAMPGYSGTKLKVQRIGLNCNSTRLGKVCLEMTLATYY